MPLRMSSERPNSLNHFPEQSSGKNRSGLPSIVSTVRTENAEPAVSKGSKSVYNKLRLIGKRRNDEGFDDEQKRDPELVRDMGGATRHQSALQAKNISPHRSRKRRLHPLTKDAYDTSSPMHHSFSSRTVNSFAWYAHAVETIGFFYPPETIPTPLLFHDYIQTQPKKSIDAEGWACSWQGIKLLAESSAHRQVLSALHLTSSAIRWHGPPSDENLQLDKGLRSLGVFGKLQVLSLAHSFGVNDDVLLTLKPELISNLTVLNLASTDVGSETLTYLGKHAKTLHTLDLSGCRAVSDETLTHIGNLVARFGRLTELNISQCASITDSGVSSLCCPASAALEVLNLSGCSGVTDMCFVGMEELKKGMRPYQLRCLNLSGSRLNGSGLGWMIDVSRHITHLCLSGCINLTDDMMLSLSRGCLNIVSLDISGATNVTDNGICQFFKSPTISTRACLNIINISHCAFVGESGVSAIAAASPALAVFLAKGVPQITEKALRILCQSCPFLNEIDISGSIVVGNTNAGSIPRIMGGALAAVALLPSLTRLRVDHVRQMDEAFLRIKPVFPGLTELSLEGCSSLTDEGINSLTKRPRSPGSDKAVSPLICSPSSPSPQQTCIHAKLVSICLAKCSLITDVGVAKIAEMCSFLERINLESCFKVGDAGVYSVAHHARGLKRMTLIRCSRVTDRGLVVLATGCRKLTHVDVRHCLYITDAGIKRLIVCCGNTLRYLDARATGVKWKVICELACRYLPFGEMSPSSQEAVVYPVARTKKRRHQVLLQQLKDIQASVCIQRSYRKYRRRVITSTLEAFFNSLWIQSSCAAARIQKIYRGFYARFHTVPLRKINRRLQRSTAAKRIQKHYRRHRHRLEMQKQLRLSVLRSRSQERRVTKAVHKFWLKHLSNKDEKQKLLEAESRQRALDSFLTKTQEVYHRADRSRKTKNGAKPWQAAADVTAMEVEEEAQTAAEEREDGARIIQSAVRRWLAKRRCTSNTSTPQNRLSVLAYVVFKRSEASRKMMETVQSFVIASIHAKRWLTCFRARQLAVRQQRELQERLVAENRRRKESSLLILRNYRTYKHKKEEQRKQSIFGVLRQKHQDRSARKIQIQYRQYKAVKLAEKQRQELQEKSRRAAKVAASKIYRAFRRAQRRKAAAIQLLEVDRLQLLLIHKANPATRNRNAAKIQHWYRQLMHRQWIHIYRRYWAACKIQAAYRGYRTRIYYNELRAYYEYWIVKIQRAFRSRQLRNRIRGAVLASRRKRAVEAKEDKVKRLEDLRLRRIAQLFQVSSERAAIAIQKVFRRYRADKHQILQARAEKVRLEKLQAEKEQQEREIKALYDVVRKKKASVVNTIIKGVMNEKDKFGFIKSAVDKALVKNKKRFSMFESKEDKEENVTEAMAMKYSILKYQSKSMPIVGFADVVLTIGLPALEQFRKEQAYRENQKLRAYQQLGIDLDDGSKERPHEKKGVHIWYLPQQAVGLVTTVVFVEPPAFRTKKEAQKRLHRLREEEGWTVKEYGAFELHLGFKGRYPINDIRFVTDSAIERELKIEGYTLHGEVSIKGLAPAKIYTRTINVTKHWRLQQIEEELSKEPWFDEATLKTIEFMAFTIPQIQDLREVFDKADLDGSGSLTKIELFAYLEIAPSIMVNATFDFFDEDKSNSIQFGEFLSAVSKICMFGKEDVNRFCFNMADRDGSGKIDKLEYKGLVDMLSDGTLNPQEADAAMAAFEKIDVKKYEAVTLDQFNEIVRRQPRLIYPIEDLQRRMMEEFMGAPFWERKKEMFATLRQEVIQEYKHLFSFAEG